MKFSYGAKRKNKVWINGFLEVAKDDFYNCSIVIENNIASGVWIEHNNDMHDSTNWNDGVFHGINFNQYLEQAKQFSANKGYIKG